MQPTNPNNEPQTYWQQLAKGGINALLFWCLNIVLLVSAYFWASGETENAPAVFWWVLAMQAVNVAVTYFQSENRAARNRKPPVS